MNILLIAGHGAGDPGAVKNGYKEAELTRELVAILKTQLSNYATVDVFDTTKNMYTYLKNGNTYNFKKYAYVFEVHFNDFITVSHGTEILIHNTEKGNSVEQKILNNICALGFKNRGIIPRGDLLVMNTVKKKYGVSHALLETCFINSATDMKRYVDNKHKVAEAICKGIVDGFGLTQTANTTSVEKAVDKLVKAGIINTPDYWLKTAKSVKHLDTLIIKFANAL